MIEKDIKNNIDKIKKILKQNSKILNITHKGCMDGVGTQIVLNNVFKYIEFVECTYMTVDTAIETINFDNYDAVLITDISPEKKDHLLDLSEKIILIDHHETAERFHDPSKLRFVYNGQCGTMLTKLFCENVFDIDLSYIDDIVNVINDYDMWKLEDPRSKKLSMVFYKIWNEKFRKRFTDGQIEFTEEEEKFFKQKDHEFNQIYSTIEMYDFNSINGCMMVADDYINEICHKALTDDGYNIVFLRNPNSKNISVRTNLENFNVGEFLFELGYGGGHSNSAGMNEKNLVKLYEKLQHIESELYKRVPELRKR